MIRNVNSVELDPVQMEGVDGASMAVMVGKGDGAPNFATRLFQVEPGGHTPHHSHDFEHEVFVVSGEGTILLDEDEHPIKAGDVIYVEANRVHQFRSGNEGMRFLCMVPMHRQSGEPTPGCGGA